MGVMCMRSHGCRQGKETEQTAERWKQPRPKGGSHKGTVTAEAGAALDEGIPHREAASAKAVRQRSTEHREKQHGPAFGTSVAGTWHA